MNRTAAVALCALSVAAWIPPCAKSHAPLQTGDPPPASGAPSTRTLTLEEALALAERHNPRLRAASAAIESAEARIVSASAYQNPTISFGSLGRQQALLQTAAVPGMLHGMNFTQPLELPSVRSSRIRAAQVQAQSSQFAQSETRLMVRGSVKQAFYEALRRKRELELTQGNLDLIEDLRRRIQVQVDVGEAARLELTRAEAEVASARIGVRAAQMRFAAAMSGLYAAVGAPLNGAEPQGSLERPPILPPLDTLREELLAKHPALALAESEIRLAEAHLENEKALRLPQPSLWMDYFQQPETAQYRFGVTLTLPLWNRRQGQIAEAQAEQRRASALATQRRVELLAALERAYNLYQVANQQVQIAEAGTLPQAEAAVRAAEAAFKFGERGILEVLDAQRVLRAARLDHLNAQFDRQQALIDLEVLRAIDLGGRP